MRAAIFIDGGYLLKQLQDAKASPDYSRIAEFLLEPLRRRIPLDLMRCYFYYCPPWVSEKPTDLEKRRLAAHERFVAEIHDLDRWQVRLGKLERRRDGDREVFVQKRVDVQLSVDLVRHTSAGHVQHVLLMAGDSDFIPAIVAAKDAGATLTLWCDRDKSVHKDLLHYADEVQYIDWKTFPVIRGRAAAELELDEGGMPVSGRKPRRTSRATPEPQASGAKADAPAEGPSPAARAKGLLTGAAARARELLGMAMPDGVEAELASAAEIAEAEQPKRGRGRRGGRGRSRGKAGDQTDAGPASGQDADAGADAPLELQRQQIARPTARPAPARPDSQRAVPAQPAAARPDAERPPKPRAEPKRQAPERVRAQRQPATEAALEVPADGDSGDDAGNKLDGDAEGTAAGGKRRRRRGGRGRRRKTGSAATSEPT